MTQLTLADAAKARVTDPVTSHDAAVRVNVAQRERQVLEALRQGPATMHTVAERTGLPLVSVSPRFRPLLNKGLIEKCGREHGRSVWMIRNEGEKT